MDQQHLAARQFGSTAEKYLASSVHAAGADLERLTKFVRDLKAARILDMGCGAGHASFALARGGACEVVAYDLAAQMLNVVSAEAAARGYAQIETCAGLAERLAFADASFDLVVTRYSAHHWLDVRGGVQEAARVLKPGGTLIVIDVLAPENPLLDTVLQTVEILRDLSHIRNYRESEWRALLEAAHFVRPDVYTWKLPIEFDGGVERIGTSAPRIRALQVVLDELPGEAREYFALTPQRTFTIDAGWFETRKQAS